MTDFFFNLKTKYGDFHSKAKTVALVLLTCLAHVIIITRYFLDWNLLNYWPKIWYCPEVQWIIGDWTLKHFSTCIWLAQPKIIWKYSTMKAGLYQFCALNRFDQNHYITLTIWFSRKQRNLMKFSPTRGLLKSNRLFRSIGLRPILDQDSGRANISKFNGFLSYEFVMHEWMFLGSEHRRRSPSDFEEPSTQATTHCPIAASKRFDLSDHLSCAIYFRLK